MRRAVLATVATLALAVPAGTAAAGHPSAVAAAKHVRVKVSECHTADAPAQRFAAFSGHMRAYPGTARMFMRFTLLERLRRAGRFEAVPLQDLRPWRRSKPGARSFIYTQRVTALREGGAYRMRVQFRWYGQDGALLHSRVLHSRACRQPAPLPNLTISSIAAGPAASGDQRVYSVTLANTGQGQARDVDVALKVDGTVVGGSRVDLLPPNESTVVQMTGPLCAFTVRAIADPDRRVRELNELDNVLTVPCARTRA